MGYGASPYDQDLDEAWAHFCNQLKAAGALVFKDVNPATPENRVDGFRYLTQNLGQAFDLALETKNTRYPQIHQFCTPNRKLGSDNADCLYHQAWIDGDSVYRITGKKGTARLWHIAVQGPRSVNAYGAGAKRLLHEPFGDTPEAQLFGDDLVTSEDGSFELYIGGARQGQNWLQTTKGARKVFFRQHFDSWAEEAGDYSIQRIDMDSPRPMPTPEDMIAAMQWAGQFVHDVVDYWPDWVWEAGNLIDPDAINAFAAPNLLGENAGRGAGRFATMARWALNKDEALIIEFDSYDGFWNITCEGVFGNSMDFLYRDVSFTPGRATVDSDGKVRIILASADPGYANWIDNQSYAAGVLTFREFLNKPAPTLSSKVVKATDLALHVPAGAKKLTTEERVRALRSRFDAIRRRYRL